MTEMSSVFDLLGIDPDDASWQDFALCVGQDIWRFHEGYESSARIAATTDAMCMSCPVRRECLKTGVENGEWGCWGGVYLINGRMDEARNSHKTEEIWNEIREGIG